MKAQIIWNDAKQKYNLVAKSKVVVTSSRLDYLQRLVKEQKHPKILKLKITDVEVVTTQPGSSGIQITDQSGHSIGTLDVAFDIEERFGFLEELIGLTIEGDAKSLIISGEGGVGKTYTVMDALSKMGKVNCNTILPTIADLDIKVEDSEAEIKEKVYAQINQPKGDFIVVKGHISPKALYRMLYENRNRVIVFDDCDKTLEDKTEIELLKAALDSYEDRWVSWYIDQPFGESDLPMTFKFNGRVIFISNKRLSKIDEAIRTRCFKVDLSMTKPQRIARMRSVIAKVMPDVDMQHKTEALDLLEENMHVTDDVNFRSLMNLITIRKSSSPNWKKLGVYALTEQ